MNRAAAALLFAAGCATAPPPAEVFADSGRPYADRLDALLALRALEGDEGRKAFDAVRSSLDAEAARGAGLSTMSELEERGCAEALLWLSERGDGAVVHLMELYLARGRRLPERVRAAAARGLGRYPKERSAGETLWTALRDPKELSSVRSAALQSLRAFHPDDLSRRVGALSSADDPWLAALQSRLR